MRRGRCSAFSGGWRVRLNVAQALMCRSDLLLLDEPTNHLDLDAIVWLEGWLRDYPGTLLLISHDREFLDRVVNRIVNIEHEQARAYRGNYSAFEEQRASELAEQAALYARQQREIRHMESFVERFRAKASKARQAQSRLKALERMQRIAPAHVDSPFEFSFAAARQAAAPAAGAGAPVGRLRRPRDHRGRQPDASRRATGWRCWGATAPASRPDEAAGRRAAGRWRARAPRRATCASATSRSISSSSCKVERIAAASTCSDCSEARRHGARRSRSCATSWPGSAFAATGCSSRWRRSPAARRRGWCWRCWPTSGPICCCWMSRPITWTWRCARRWRWRCRTTRARWCWCRTTGICCAWWPTSCCWCTPGRVEPFDGDLEDYARWLVEQRGGAGAGSGESQAASGAAPVGGGACRWDGSRHSRGTETTQTGRGRAARGLGRR